MKKILLSVVAVMALGTAQAQEVQFGAKAGVNFANFGGDVEDASSRTGFHAGVVAELKLSETFSIQPELLYSQQGSQTEDTFSESFGGVNYSTNTEAKQTLNYINLPILAKYYVMEGLSLEVGPQVGFLISAESKYDMTTTSEGGGTTVSETESGSVDNKDAYKSIDFGVVAGVGYELPMGLFFQARYQAGLSSVLEDSEELDDADFSTTNNVVSLSVGFKF